MASSQSLLASARSAYRHVLRASSSTFAGDPLVLNAFRLKIRNEILPYGREVDPKQLQEKVTLVREIADVLRKNVVQAQKVDHASSDEKEKWKVRITEHTELGSNDSIQLAVAESSRSAKKEGGKVLPIITSADVSASDPKLEVPRYYSQLKKAHKDRAIPELKEEDLEESFVRGSGPGGQSVNKTENNVQILHKPTGLRVACQETRSLKQNRKLARRILLDKLDALYNPGLSKQEMAKAKQIERSRRRKKKAKKKVVGQQAGNKDD
ncbi:putative peptide chain release factor C12orf65, mitochondrial [Grifola frondosa]|uniref:Putative peptide chain release factor C12orf65, mitochondrial n=1 Tax=Grifola frondosa TaxID=5627 RepID=A0A1C7MFV0_GRIFR|nr:putative peptide chain release factor C12orf65, mitochondrial [Grifola frondosa]